ncbi:MAG: hypothetical protein JJU36_14995 [Phycisphaeraceae bacterium]|nr:hypothetical protein [Phycisphaeraceae bacterium]
MTEWFRFNPMIVAGIEARLRRRQFIPWALMMIIITTFGFLLAYLAATGRGHAAAQEAARIGLMPLLVIQGIVLIFLGTGRIAAAMVEMREKGILDFHRMTPMSPGNKIIGQLFGLPAREYALCLITMPFVMFCWMVGQIHLLVLAELYLVFFSSVILYHSIAMVMGMVARSPRTAFVGAQGMVFLFHLVIPAFSGLGFQFLEYLTVRPTFVVIASEQIQGVEAELRMFEDVHALREVAFFGIGLQSTLFSLLLQGLVTSTILVVLHRKWRSPQHHALSKIYAVALFGGFQFLVVGCVTPFLASTVRFARLGEFGMLTLGYSYFVLSASAAIFLIHITTPSGFEYQRGLRLARKHRLPRLPAHRDEAPSGLWALGIALIGAMGYSIIFLAAWYYERLDTATTGARMLFLPAVWWMAMVMSVHQARAWGEERGLFLYGVFVWMVPVLLGILLLVADVVSFTTACYFTTPSGLLAPIWLVLPVIELYAFVNDFGPKHRAVLAVLVTIWPLLALAIFARLNLMRHNHLRTTVRSDTVPESSSSEYHPDPPGDDPVRMA